MKILLTLMFLLSVTSYANDEVDEPGTEDFENGTGPNSNPNESDYTPLVKMQLPNFSGSGCDNSSARGILSPDNSVLTVFFDDMNVSAGSNKLRERKFCDIQIPFHVPQGYRVAIVKTDYRGFVLTAPGTKSKLVAKYLFTDAQSNQPLFREIRRRKWFNQEHPGDFFVNSFQTRPVWSHCGQDFNLRIHSRIVAISNREQSLVQISLDSADTTSKVQVGYHLRWKKCRN